MVIGDLQNLCPVCGYKMDEPPIDYNICPSCGTEFGVNDVNATIQDLRMAWIDTGPKWWSQTDPQPKNWNPFLQLALAMSPIISESNSVLLPAEIRDLGREEWVQAQQFADRLPAAASW